MTDFAAIVLKYYNNNTSEYESKRIIYERIAGNLVASK